MPQSKSAKAAGDSSKSAAKPKLASSPIANSYLVVYNAASAAGWLIILVRTLMILAQFGPRYVFLGVGERTRLTQTLAVMEILHSVFGIVRAPILTTVMQVFSRLLLVWGVVYPFPYLALTPFYSSMLIAWSVTEVIRYGYFTLSLSGHQFSGLTWLRYSGFFVLYPLGITSECVLIYLATGPAGDVNPLYKYALYGILAIYVPGSYTLYSYMMAQRRKVMKAKDTKATQ